MSEPGMDEAVEAAALAVSHFTPEQMRRWRDTSKGQRYRSEAYAAVEAAYPIIAAAVRADERAKVLAKIWRHRMNDANDDGDLFDRGMRYAWWLAAGQPNDDEYEALRDQMADQAGVDLDAIEKKWLDRCGACDGGLPMACTCPDEDPRPVISALVVEAARLRALGAGQ